MKKFVIIEEKFRGDPYWTIHSYNWLFKLFGPSSFTVIIGTTTSSSEERCKELFYLLNKEYEIKEIIQDNSK